MSYTEDDYLCHFCNTPLDETDLGEHMTDYNGREYYFCSYSCLKQWDTADTLDYGDGEDYDAEC